MPMRRNAGSSPLPFEAPSSAMSLPGALSVAWKRSETLPSLARPWPTGLMAPQPPDPGPQDLPAAQPNPIPATEPGKDTTMTTDSIVSPSGQTVVAGHGDHCRTGDKSFEAVHWATASDHRTSLANGLEARFAGRDHADTLRSFTDLERQNGERFQVLANQIKEEGSRTREMIQAQKLEDLRFANLRLELAKG